MWVCVQRKKVCVNPTYRSRDIAKKSDFCTQNHTEIQFFVIFTQHRQVYIPKEAEFYAELYTIGFSLIKQNLISK